MPEVSINIDLEQKLKRMLLALATVCLSARAEFGADFRRLNISGADATITQAGVSGPVFHPPEVFRGRKIITTRGCESFVPITTSWHPSRGRRMNSKKS
jgi:hypothetical protein